MQKESKYFVQRMDGVLLLSFAAAEAEVITVKKDFGMGKPFYPSINIEGRINYFVYIWKDVHKQARFIIKKIQENPNFLPNLCKIWQRRAKKLKDFEKKISSMDLKKLSNKELGSAFYKLIHLYQEEYSPALLCDSFSLHTDQIIAKKLKNITEMRNEPRKFAEYLETLTSPIKKSFTNKEEASLLKIAKKIKADKKLSQLFKKDLKKIKKETSRYPHLKQALEKHQKDYFWIENSYAQGIKLEQRYFLRKIKRILKEEINLDKKIRQLENWSKNCKRKKKNLIIKLKLDKEFKKILKWIEVFGWLHDARKAVVMETNYYISLVLKEIGERLNLSLHEMYYCDHHKIGEMLLKKEVNKKVIHQRMKICAHLVWPNKYELVTGEKAKQWYQEILEEKKEAIRDLEGISASTGVFIGRAKIVEDIKDGHKIKKKDILVAGMTRPHWMSFIKKVGALVTDEGGITCHAAIVAREMGVPCIIGTKIATKIIKDNDLVEVNTNHNRVRILKRE